MSNENAALKKEQEKGAVAGSIDDLLGDLVSVKQQEEEKAASEKRVKEKTEKDKESAAEAKEKEAEARYQKWQDSKKAIDTTASEMAMERSVPNMTSLGLAIYRAALEKMDGSPELMIQAIGDSAASSPEIKQALTDIEKIDKAIESLGPEDKLGPETKSKLEAIRAKKRELFKQAKSTASGEWEKTLAALSGKSKKFEAGRQERVSAINSRLVEQTDGLSKQETTTENGQVKLSKEGQGILKKTEEKLTNDTGEKLKTDFEGTCRENADTLFTLPNQQNYEKLMAEFKAQDRTTSFRQFLMKKFEQNSMLNTVEAIARKKGEKDLMTKFFDAWDSFNNIAKDKDKGFQKGAMENLKNEKLTGLSNQMLEMLGTVKDIPVQVERITRTIVQPQVEQLQGEMLLRGEDRKNREKIKQDFDDGNKAFAETMAMIHEIKEKKPGEIKAMEGKVQEIKGRLEASKEQANKKASEQVENEYQILQKQKEQASAIKTELENRMAAVKKELDTANEQLSKFDTDLKKLEEESSKFTKHIRSASEYIKENYDSKIEEAQKKLAALNSAKKKLLGGFKVGDQDYTANQLEESKQQCNRTIATFEAEKVKMQEAIKNSEIEGLKAVNKIEKIKQERAQADSTAKNNNSELTKLQEQITPVAAEAKRTSDLEESFRNQYQNKVDAARRGILDSDKQYQADQTEINKLDTDIRKEKDALEKMSAALQERMVTEFIKANPETIKEADIKDKLKGIAVAMTGVDDPFILVNALSKKIMEKQKEKK